MHIAGKRGGTSPIPASESHGSNLLPESNQDSPKNAGSPGKVQIHCLTLGDILPTMMYTNDHVLALPWLEVAWTY